MLLTMNTHVFLNWGIFHLCSEDFNILKQVLITIFFSLNFSQLPLALPLSLFYPSFSLLPLFLYFSLPSFSFTLLILINSTNLTLFYSSFHSFSSVPLFSLLLLHLSLLPIFSPHSLPRTFNLNPWSPLNLTTKWAPQWKSKRKTFL